MRSVIFDLDCTLIDTAPDLIDTLNFILTREGLRAIPFDRARAAIGQGAKRLLEAGLAEQGARLTPMQLDRLYVDYVAHYAEHIADRSRPFPGLDAALDRLRDDGYLLAVCTNKLEWLSVRLLDAVRLRHRFKVICGQDTFKIAKPNPEILLRTISAAGGNPAEAVMVGDSATDIATARAAGVPIVAVDFGYTDTPITALRPDRVISSYDQLSPAVNALMRLQA